MRTTRTRALLAALAASLVGLGTAAVPAPASAAPATWTVRVGSQSANMAVQGMRFLPGEVTVDAGDTVTWRAGSAEIHTVTFFPGGGPQTSLPPFDPGDLSQLTQQGGSTYDPAQYFSSGLMTTVPSGGDVGPLPPVPHVQSYSLTFPEEGTFTYYCLVHGLMMVGTVHVQAAGTPYPYTQRQYDEQARLMAAGLLADGQSLRRELWRRSTMHRVFLGGDDDAVALMRFIRPHVVVRVGQEVVFKNVGLGAPHTVTFGEEPPPPDLFGPSGDPAHYRGGALSSGILPPGSRFTVTFTRPGRYRYVCALHDSMGMVGTVVVRR